MEETYFPVDPKLERLMRERSATIAYHEAYARALRNNMTYEAAAEEAKKEEDQVYYAWKIEGE